VLDEVRRQGIRYRAGLDETCHQFSLGCADFGFAAEATTKAPLAAGENASVSRQSRERATDGILPIFKPRLQSHCRDGRSFWRVEYVTNRRSRSGV
jgi:hypothetical protein